MKTEGQWQKFCDGWRIQLYWPELTCQSGEWFFAVDTCFRLQTKGKAADYRAIGFKILGFGLGIDKWKPETAYGQTVSVTQETT